MIRVSVKRIQPLVAERRIYGAIQELEALATASHRVFGLDQDLAKLRRAAAEVEALLLRSEQRLQAGDAGGSMVLLKRAADIAQDHPKMDLLEAVADEAIQTSQEEFALATSAAEKSDWHAALRHCDQALAGNASDKDAARLRQRAEQALNAARQRRRGLLLGGVLGAAMLGVLLASLTAYLVFAARAREREVVREAEIAKVQGLLASAEAEIEGESYERAQSLLRESEQVLSSLEEQPPDRLLRRTQSLRNSHELKMGLAGSVPWRGQWMSPEERDRARQAEQETRTRIERLRATLQDAQQQPGLETQSLLDLRQAARLLSDALETLERASERSAASHRTTSSGAGAAYHRADQLASPHLEGLGYVRHEGAWMTHDQRMRAMGRVQHQGQWVTPERQEAMEMTAKGMVRYGDEWVTPDEAERREMTARGLVEHEGRWVTAEEKFKIEQEAKGLVLVGEEWLDKEVALRRLFRGAYAYSKDRVKLRLKAPSQARFPEYESDAVRIELSEEGEVIVSAWVDSPNPFGTILRLTYLVKVVPTNDGWTQWTAGEVIFVD